MTVHKSCSKGYTTCPLGYYLSGMTNDCSQGPFQTLYQLFARILSKENEWLLSTRVIPTVVSPGHKNFIREMKGDCSQGLFQLLY